MIIHRLLLAATPIALVLAPASAQEAPSADVLTFYPPAALAAGIGGHVWLNCTSTAQRQLKDCQVLEESPAGQGFGAAALKMAAQSKPNLRVNEPEVRNARRAVTFDAQRPLIFPDIREPLSWIEAPKWLVQPTPDQLSGYFPRGTRERAGRATLRCTVMADTTAKDCKVVEETPPKAGFGAAALEASKLFRLSPKKIDGEPQDGGVITVTLNFSR